MYKALKSALSEIEESVLKLVVETREKTNTSRCPRGEPCQCALITQSVPKVEPVKDTRLDDIENTLQFLHQKQNAQYEVLVGGIQSLNVSLANIVKILSQQTVETATTIPNLSPLAEASDLKNVHVSHVGNLPAEFDEESAIEADITPDIEEAEEEAEEVPDVEEEVPDVEEAEDVPDVEEAEEVPDVEEEGIEVEEWTFKGRKYFKDTENTVYANDNGELGDAIGLYDPVKNIVKKLPTSS